MTDSRLDRYREVYLAMVKHAGYRPAAPSDGFGGITLSEEQMRDSAVIEAEARRYASLNPIRLRGVWCGSGIERDRKSVV